MKTTLRSWILILLVVFATPLYSENRLKIPDYNDRLWGIRFMNSSVGYVIGTEGRLFKVLPESQVIVPLTTGTTTSLNAVEFIDENTGFAVGVSGFIIKTTDAGETWNQLPLFTSETLRNIKYENNALYGVGSFGTCFKSTDGGENWIDMSIFMNGHFFDVEILNPEGYMVSDNSAQPFWKTTNGGITWTGYSLPSSISGKCLFAENERLCIFGINRTTLQRVILHSTDEGENWSSAYLAAEGMDQNGIDFSNTGTGFCLAASHSLKTSKIFKTTNGIDWTLYKEVAREYYSMTCSGSYLYLTSDSGTIYQEDLVVGISQYSSEIPEIYSLSQNYPNPFNPETKINFSLPVSGLVLLTIYDITGREVEILVNEVLSIGNYTYSFTASALTSGTYFYRLETENFVQTKTMMLIK